MAKENKIRNIKVKKIKFNLYEHWIYIISIFINVLKDDFIQLKNIIYIKLIELSYFYLFIYLISLI